MLALSFADRPVRSSGLMAHPPPNGPVGPHPAGQQGGGYMSAEVTGPPLAGPPADRSRPPFQAG